MNIPHPFTFITPSDHQMLWNLCREMVLTRDANEQECPAEWRWLACEAEALLARVTRREELAFDEALAKEGKPE